MADDDEPRIALKFMRFHAPSWMYCDSVDDAVASAYWMVEDQNGWPVEVVSVEGVVLLTEKELDARRDAFEKKGTAEYRPPSAPPPIAEPDQAAALAFSKFMGLHAASAEDWHGLSGRVKDIWRAKAKEGHPA